MARNKKNSRIPALRKLGLSVAEDPWRMVGATVLVTILMVLGAGAALETGRTEFRTNINDLFPDYEEMDIMDQIGEDFGNYETFIVLVKADDVLTPKAFEKTSGAIIKLKNDPRTWRNVIGENDVEKNLSFISLPTILEEYSQISWGSTTSQDIRDILKTYLNDNNIPEVYRKLAASLLPKNFNPDSDNKIKSMVLYVTLDGGLSDTELEALELHMRDDIINDFRGSGVEMYTYAFGLLSTSYGEAEATMEPLFVLAVIAIFALSLINYRRLSDALLANLTLLIVIIWTFCIIGIVGFDYNFMNIMVPLLITGLAIDFSFHAIIGYRERLWGTKQPEIRIKKAAIGMITFVGIAFILATVTTTFGFLSNIVSDLQAITEFGIVAAFGVVFACVLNVTFVPAIRIILDKRRLKKGKELKGAIPPKNISAKPGRVLGPIFNTVKHPWAFIIVLIVIAIPGYVLLPNMRATYDPTGELLETQDITIAFRTLNEDYSVGTETIIVRIDGNFEYKGIWDHANLSIWRARDDKYIAKADGAAKVEWIGSILPSIGYNNSYYLSIDSNLDGIPDRGVSQEEIKPWLDNLTAEYPILNQFIHKGPQGYDGIIIRFITKTNLGEHGLDAKKELEHDFESFSFNDVDAKIQYTGEPIIWNKGLDDFRESLFMSTILVLIFAFILLIIVFGIIYRSPLLGLLTAIPPVLAIGWTLGFMAVSGIPLNMMTAFVGSFTVGLGIDYPIHMVTRWVEERKKKKSILECYTITIRSTGKELGFSALTTLSAFIAFALMPMPVMREFGIVMVAAIVFSYLGAVLMMPMLIRVWHRKD